MTFVVDTSYITTPGSDLSILSEDICCVPRVWEELKNMVAVDQLLTYNHFRILPPSHFYCFVPCAIFRDYIIEVEDSISRGLRVAEKYMGGKDKKLLREEYREKVRRGLIDSVGDFDTLVLALGLKVPILTKDIGMKKMAEKLGISIY